MDYNQPLGKEKDAPYIDANPSAGVEGSAVPAAAIEHPQREIVNVLKKAGEIPDAGKLDQLATSIEKIARKAAKEIPDGVENSVLIGAKDKKYTLKTMQELKELLNVDYKGEVYQQVESFAGNVLEVKENVSIYKKTLDGDGSVSIEFDASQVNNEENTVTFELLIDLSQASTIPTISFISPITWLNYAVPEINEKKMYLFVFRRFAGGIKWVGNLQGVC